ncbi:hypothetical protein CVT25_012774 [Psilocybe cyanescens]|uniref:Uncharacterized protein n=1 Tax=Psilocybe cyanescens TaxID=93625 RepID=A0A409W9H5_PSICY|nr:hypothetical protein CVT25_012774 [Psilocybe cyanescens]
MHMDLHISVGLGLSGLLQQLASGRLGMLIEEPRSIALRAKCVVVLNYESALAHKPCKTADEMV